MTNVERHTGHLDTGILGAKYLLHALTDAGRVDVAYRIATQTTPPSYGSWVQRGATTLWEDWGDGDSRNHIMLGDISAWFYQALAGINLDPRSAGLPAHHHPAAADRRSDMGSGRARVDLWADRGGMEAQRQLLLPGRYACPSAPRPRSTFRAKEAAGITEGGKAAEKAANVKFLRFAEGSAVYEVGSGSYSFVSGNL